MVIICRVFTTNDSLLILLVFIVLDFSVPFWLNPSDLVPQFQFLAPWSKKILKESPHVLIYPQASNSMMNVATPYPPLPLQRGGFNDFFHLSW